MSATLHNFPSPIDRMIALADEKLRGHCQADADCYKVADISDAATSLAYCMFHFWRRNDEAAWQTFERMEHRG